MGSKTAAKTCFLRYPADYSEQRVGYQQIYSTLYKYAEKLADFILAAISLLSTVPHVDFVCRVHTNGTHSTYLTFYTWSFYLYREYSSLTATDNRPLVVSHSADLFLAYYNNTVNHQRSNLYAPTHPARRYAIIIIIIQLPHSVGIRTLYTAIQPHSSLHISYAAILRGRSQDISCLLPYLRSRSIV